MLSSAADGAITPEETGPQKEAQLKAEYILAQSLTVLGEDWRLYPMKQQYKFTFMCAMSTNVYISNFYLKLYYFLN